MALNLGTLGTGGVAGAVVIEVRANLARLEKDLADAKRRMQELDRASGAGMFKSMAGGANELALGLNYLKGNFSALLGVAAGSTAGLLATGAAFHKASQAVEDFTAIIVHARTVGVSTDFLQSLQFAALSENVSVEKLNTALLRFTFVSEQAATGQGKLYDSLKLANPELAQQFRFADQEERFKIIADAAGKYADVTKKAQITNAAFGRGMGDLVRVFGSGREKIDSFTRQARELGIVIDEKLLQNAEKLNARMDVATKIIDVQLKQAFLDLAPTIATVAENIAWAVRGFTDWLARSKEAKDLTSTQVTDEMQRLLAQMEEDRRWLEDYKKRRESGDGATAELGEQGTREQRQIDDAKELLRLQQRIREERQRPAGAYPGADPMKNRGLGDGASLRDMVREQTRALGEETRMLEAQAATIGMTAGEAAAYLKIKEMQIKNDIEHVDVLQTENKEYADQAAAMGRVIDKIALLNAAQTLQQDVKIAEAQVAATRMTKTEAEAYLRVKEMLIRTNQTEASVNPALLQQYRDQAEALAELRQELSAIQAAKDMQFEADTMFMTDMEKRVASFQRQMHGDQWKDFMSDPTSNMIRFMEVMQKTEQLTQQFAQTFVSDLMNGATAVDALRNALNNLAQDLTRMAMNMAIKMLFQQLMQLGMGAMGGMPMPMFGGGGVASGADGVSLGAPTEGWDASWITSGPVNYAKGGVMTRRRHAAEPADVGSLFAKGGVVSWEHDVSAMTQKFALGGVVTEHPVLGRLRSFADGGSIVTKPTMFPMAGGETGQMGEAGPEAIMPLARLPSGGLGVRSQGAPKVNVTVVEAPGKGGEQNSKQNENGDFDVEVYVESIVTKSMSRPGAGPNRILRQMGSRMPPVRR
jgi:hypothetical protein